MMHNGGVLIVSTVADVATDDVVRRLSARDIPHIRLNTEDYPFARTFAYQPSNITDGHWLLCDGVPVPYPTAVWYRRLRTPPKPVDMNEGVYTFCLQENRAA